MVSTLGVSEGGSSKEAGGCEDNKDILTTGSQCKLLDFPQLSCHLFIKKKKTLTLFIWLGRTGKIFLRNLFGCKLISKGCWGTKAITTAVLIL